MDAQSILAAKVAYLSGNSANDIDEAMKKYVSTDTQLQQELAFVETFWDSELDERQEQPSSQLDARFYQMLSMAQATQRDTAAQFNNAETQTSGQGFLARLTDWLTPKPAMQLAMMAGIFALGYYVNMPQAPTTSDDAMVNLQQEVQSLNSLVALSMIENNSASKRLTGINYSKQSDSNDQTLNNALLKMINTDKSTAVRLAAIDALYARGLQADNELTLLAGLNEQNLMVQIDLVKLLSDQGSEVSRIKLKDMAANGDLHQEVKEFFEQHQRVHNQNQSI